jgi:hypothetical protein
MDAVGRVAEGYRHPQATGQTRAWFHQLLLNSAYAMRSGEIVRLEAFDCVGR